MALRIGMIGGGTVGGGVYDLLTRRVSSPLASIKKICVRDLTKPRSFTVDPQACALTDQIDDVLNDDTLNCVIEVMGGTGIAKDVVLRALGKGKHVVTANKALIAEHLPEIQSAILAAPGGPSFAYEAAVCGAIPIINTLQTCYEGDVVTSVMGICNGTTNFMLCKMEGGADYGEVLKEAQDLGFAEADPTADVEGHDVRAKISILAKLAYGVTVPISAIPTKGISSVTSVDFEYAKSMGCTIKLIGTAARTSKHGEHDGPLSVYVAPKMVPVAHVMGGIGGAGNAVAVTSENMGMAAYTGPGAGRYPTANSVVADVMRIARGNQGEAFPKSAELELSTDYESAFYIRISISDGLGIIKSVGACAEKSGVSISQILQNTISDREAVDFCVTTEVALLSQVKMMCEELKGLSFVKKEPSYMPIQEKPE